MFLKVEGLAYCMFTNTRDVWFIIWRPLGHLKGRSLPFGNNVDWWVKQQCHECVSRIYDRVRFNSYEWHFTKACRTNPWVRLWFLENPVSVPLFLQLSRSWEISVGDENIFMRIYIFFFILHTFSFLILMSQDWWNSSSLPRRSRSD